MLFLFSKSRKYWFDLEPIKEPLVRPEAAGHRFGGNSPDVGRRRGAEYTPGAGKNPGDVWSITTKPFREAHFAVMPPELAERAVLAGCKPGGIVLDPFSGSGTTGMVALRHGRRYVGIDLSEEYLDLSLRTRLAPS
jgi:site-specific DNA-methyltransferase (cytosine-N4-specific)